MQSDQFFLRKKLSEKCGGWETGVSWGAGEKLKRHSQALTLQPGHRLKQKENGALNGHRQNCRLPPLDSAAANIDHDNYCKSARNSTYLQKSYLK
jgi:hypothetical protein